MYIEVAPVMKLAECTDIALLHGLIRKQHHRNLTLGNCNAMLLQECIYWRSEHQYHVFNTRSISLAELPKAVQFMYLVNKTDLPSQFGVELE